MSEPCPARGGQLPPQVLDLPLLTLVLAPQAVDLALLAVVLPLQAVVLLLQTIIVALQALVGALAPCQLRTKPFDFGLQIAQVLVRIAVGGLQAKVMPQF